MTSPVVKRVDEEALAVARAIAQLVGFEDALPRQHRLSHDAVAEPDLRMRHRKIRIDRDGTLEERDGRRAQPVDMFAFHAAL